jgi:hypothetical protein
MTAYRVMGESATRPVHHVRARNPQHVAPPLWKPGALRATGRRDRYEFVTQWFLDERN